MNPPFSVPVTRLPATGFYTSLGFNGPQKLRTGVTDSVTMDFGSNMETPLKYSQVYLNKRQFEFSDSIYGMPLFSRASDTIHTTSNELGHPIVSLWNLGAINEKAAQLHELQVHHFRPILEQYSETKYSDPTVFSRLGVIERSNNSRLLNAKDTIEFVLPKQFQKKFKFIGLSQGGATIKDQAITVIIGEDAVVVDYWNFAPVGHKLWLIYRPTRKNDKGKYDLNLGPPQFLAYHSLGAIPSEELEYISINGDLCFAPYYFVGTNKGRIEAETGFENELGKENPRPAVDHRYGITEIRIGEPIYRIL